MRDVAHARIRYGYRRLWVARLSRLMRRRSDVEDDNAFFARIQTLMQPPGSTLPKHSDRYSNRSTQVFTVD